MFWCVSCTAIVLAICFQSTKPSQVLTDDFPLAKGSVQLANSCSEDAADIGIQGSLSADFTLNSSSCHDTNAAQDLNPWDSTVSPIRMLARRCLCLFQVCHILYVCPLLHWIWWVQNGASHLWFIKLWRAESCGRRTTQIRHHPLTLALTASSWLLKDEIRWV